MRLSCVNKYYLLTYLLTTKWSLQLKHKQADIIVKSTNMILYADFVMLVTSMSFTEAYLRRHGPRGVVAAGKVPKITNLANSYSEVSFIGH